MSPQVMLPGDILNTAPATRWMPTPGEYVLVVDECREEANTSEKGGSRIVVVNKVQSGPGASVADAGKTIFSSYQLSQDGLKYLRRFIEATGVLELVAANGGRLDTDWFVGKQYACRVSIRKDFPNVSDERPVGAPSSRGGQAQAQAAQAPSMLAPVQPQMPYQPPMQQQYAQQPMAPQYAQQPMAPQQYAQPGMPMPQMPAFPAAPQQPTVAVPPPPPGYGQGQGR